MSSLGKTMIAMSASALVIGVTLSMRARSEPARPAQLTPAQAAELATPKPPAPAAQVKPVNSARDLPPPPPDDEPDIEDGDGS
jgi:hypothetical protein